MALARYESVAVNKAGDVVPNATVEVRRDQPGRPVVPLFADRAGTMPLGNPITADFEGKFGFHAPGGVYYIRVFTGPSQQPLQEYVRRYQAIGTAAERDVEDLASALEAGTASFPTLADLQLFVPAKVEGIDLLRVSASRVRVSNLLFRPRRGNDRPLVVYGGECEIDHNRFLGGAANTGSAILLTDSDPDTSSFVAGAYSHWVHHNLCGAAGYEPLCFVETAGTSGGQNDNRYDHNRILADVPFYLHAGGGIVISNNKMQSSTGTGGAPAGKGVDCIGVFGVEIGKNYIERYQHGIYIRATAGDVYDGGNHWDNVTNHATSLSGAPLIRRRAIESGVQNLGFTANGQTLNPPADVTNMLAYSVGGGGFTGCQLGPGTVDGQTIRLLGGSSAVTLGNTNVRWHQGASSKAFGTGAGETMCAELVWVAQVNKWWQMSIDSDYA